MIHLYLENYEDFSQINAVESRVCNASYSTKCSKDDWKCRRWQWPAVQYILTPPEVVVITFCIARYRKKVSLKPILEILVVGCNKNMGKQ